MGERPERKWLSHDVPTWVRGNPDFFVTVCALERGRSHLLDHGRAERLVESARFQHRREVWHVHCFLVMPDHLHVLLAIHPNHELKKTFADWKRYTTRSLGISWQEGMFEHRIRNAHDFAETWQYIADNPMRAGLVEAAESWPHQVGGPVLGNRSRVGRPVLRPPRAAEAWRHSSLPTASAEA